MDLEFDHYAFLGLPSGEGSAKLTEKEITKAYRKKALELHPDKSPNDLNAQANFTQLQASYSVLKDEKTRKLFDDFMCIKRKKALHQSQLGSKRQKMMSDLDAREKAAFAPDPERKAREEEERITRKLHEEIAAIRAQHANEEERITRKLHEEISRIRVQHANKFASTTPQRTENAAVGVRECKGGGAGGLDEEKILKVYWKKIGEDYSAQRLRELFEKFGNVEDVVIKSSKKRGSALVVMASKDAAVAATGFVFGDLLNPIDVRPLDRAKNTAFSSPLSQEPEGPKLSNLGGASHQSFEDFVLKKMMQKAAEKQK